MVYVHQIYYNANTKAHLDPAFYPFLNTIQDEYFENTVIRQIYERTLKLKGMEYIGVLSWKQHLKTYLTGQEIISRIHRDIAGNQGKDVYLLGPITDNSNLQMSSNFPDEPRIISGKITGPDGWMERKARSQELYRGCKMLNDSGVLPVNLFDGKWQYSKCNYWIVKRHVFNDYLENWLIPAMDFFRTIEDILPKDFSHSSGRTITSISFTLEYLFGSFLAHSDYSFEYLVKKKYPGLRNRQWVNITGYENTDPLIETRGRIKHVA